MIIHHVVKNHPTIYILKLIRHLSTDFGGKKWDLNSSGIHERASTVDVTENVERIYVEEGQGWDTIILIHISWRKKVNLNNDPKELPF